MRVIGFVLIVCIAMAALRAAAAVVVLLLAAFVIVSAIRAPMQTFGGLLTLLLLGAVGQYPVVGLIFIGGLVVMGLIRQCRKRG